MSDKSAVLNTEGPTREDGGRQYVYTLIPPFRFDNADVHIGVVRVWNDKTLFLANGDTIMQRYGTKLSPSEVLGHFGYEEIRIDLYPKDMTP